MGLKSKKLVAYNFLVPFLRTPGGKIKYSVNMAPGCQCELWPKVSCNEVTAGSTNTHSHGHIHRHTADRGDTITPDPTACIFVCVQVCASVCSQWEWPWQLEY